MKKLKPPQGNYLLSSKRQISQASELSTNLNCNQDELSDETTEREHCLAQSSTAGHELPDAIADDADYDQVFDQCQNAQKAARQTLQAAKRMITASSQPINSVATMQIEPTKFSSRLPQINLPCFSGDFTAWLSFIDSFRSTVHDNDKLSPVQKLMYLKGCLTSHASKLIMSLETTESNYEVALQMLQLRYKNDRVSLRKLLSRIYCTSNGECVSASSAALSLQ